MKGRKKSLLILVTIMLISPCLTRGKTNTIERKGTSQPHNPILFLHGLDKSWMDWYTMMVWFKDDGWPNTTNFYAGYAYDFEDPYNCSFQAYINNAHKIKQWVEDILTETGAEKIDLVGHSDGGLSSRYYIKFLGGIDRVDDYVSLGSPHHGDHMMNSTRCKEMITMVLSLNEGDETPGGILNDTLGNRVDPFLGVTYNSTHIPGTINYTSIYSQDDELIPYISPPLDGAHNIEVEKLSHTKLLSNKSVYELVKAAVDDTLPPTTTTTPSTTTTSMTNSTTTSTISTTTEETPLTLIPVIVAMSSGALIMILHRRQIKRKRK